MTRLLTAVLAGIAVFYTGSAQDVVMEVDSTLEDGTFDAQEYPLHHLVSSGETADVRTEIEKGTDLNVQNNHGWTPLMFAVEHKRDEIFDMLMDAGVDLDIQENDGWTALMFAGFHGDEAMVDRILADGGNALLTNVYHYAAHTITHNREHFDLAQKIASAGVRQALATDDLDTCIALIQEGADVHSQNENGWTALTLAASLNRVGEVGWLLHDMQANPDWLENDGWSPLMFAANNDYYEVAELLINAGADVSQVSVSGVSAVSLAEEHGFTALLELLTSAATYRPSDHRGSGSGSEGAEEEEQQGYSEVPEGVFEPQVESTTAAAAADADAGSASTSSAASDAAAAPAAAEKHEEKKKSGSWW